MEKKTFSIGQFVNINVETNYGIIPVEFMVMAILPNDHYGLTGQERVCVGEMNGDSWKLSRHIDLFELSDELLLDSRAEEWIEGWG